MRSSASLHQEDLAALSYVAFIFGAGVLGRNLLLADICGFAIGVGTILMIVISIKCQRDQKRSARLFSEVVGDVVGERGRAHRPVPVSARDYTVWCEEHGLQPYPFGKPDWG
jgi:hypothetical protein